MADWANSDSLGVDFGTRSASEQTNRIASQGGVIEKTAAFSVTRDMAGKTIALNNTTGFAVTLPTALGTGLEFKFVFAATVGSGAMTIKSVRGADVWFGLALGLDGDGVPANAWAASGTVDGANFDGTTQGGVVGDTITLLDVAANKWLVQARVQQSGTEATPFTDTVT